MACRGSNLFWIPRTVRPRINSWRCLTIIFVTRYLRDYKRKIFLRITLVAFFYSFKDKRILLNFAARKLFPRSVIHLSIMSVFFISRNKFFTSKKQYFQDLKFFFGFKSWCWGISFIWDLCFWICFFYLMVEFDFIGIPTSGNAVLQWIKLRNLN